MELVVEETGPCRKKLSIEIPAEDVKKEFTDVVKLYQQSVQVPGFRPGKAPVNVVKKRYAKKIEDEVKGRLIPKNYQQALQQESIDVVSILDVVEKELDAENAWQFEVVLDVPPRFELPDYTSIQVETKTVEVKEAAIDDTLGRIRNEMSRYEDIEPRAIEKGDMACIDFKGSIEGVPVAEVDEKAAGISEAEDFWVVVDENSFLPGFDTALVGAKPGDEVGIDVPFEETFHVQGLAGKTAQYEVKVKQLRAKKPCEDEALLSIFKVESLDQLRERISEDLSREAELSERRRVRTELIQKLTDSTTMELPKSEVSTEVNQTIQDIVRENTYRGIEEDQLMDKKDEIFSAAEKGAVDRVKLRYILHKIADEEKVEVEEKEFQNHAKAMAAHHQIDAKEFLNKIRDENKEEGMRSDFRLEKTLEFLVDQILPSA